MSVSAPGAGGLGPAGSTPATVLDTVCVADVSAWETVCDTTRCVDAAVPVTVWGADVTVLETACDTVRMVEAAVLGATCGTVTGVDASVFATACVGDCDVGGTALVTV